jgi:hypothetical protein
LAGPSQDVGSAGRRESVFAGLRMYGVDEAWPLILFVYLGATAIAWATKMIGQLAMKTIIPNATSSDK